MIHESSTSAEWILKIAKDKKADPILVQKAIRALFLLEGLSESNLKFVFKGGTALMLLLGSTRRLSIDIDVIIPESRNLGETLHHIATSKSFLRIEEQHRENQDDIKKTHFKFFFENALKHGSEDYILLDILFEKILYQQVIPVLIESPFVFQEGEARSVPAPDFNNIMGDKLTAFAPNTIGIPYFKKERSMGLEIIKQLYDVGNIFPHIDNSAIVGSVFNDFAKTEMAYRALDNNIQLVLDDIFENCYSICTRGKSGNANFKILQMGIKQADAYIFSESYHLEKAITHAARAAYMTALIQAGSPVMLFQSGTDMKDWTIDAPYQGLQKLKKTNPEAFYYWHQCLQLKKHESKNIKAK